MTIDLAIPDVAVTRTEPDRWPRLRLLLRMKLPLTAACVLVLLALVAIVGPALVQHSGNTQNLDFRFLHPFALDHGFLFVLGGDALGRPILAQVILGARTSLLIGVLAVGGSGLVGFTLGLLSGYFGGWLDALVMRLADVIHTLPSLLLALAVLYVLSPSLTNLVLVLAVTRIPVYLRTARAQTLEVRERVFVEAARAIGSPTWRIVLRDVRPLVVPTMMTVAMLEIANVILAAAGLSFLGVGLQRPQVDWGIMVADGRDYLATAWWVTLFPGLAVVITALAANILSNWLRAVEDPTQSAVLVASAANSEVEATR